MPSTARRGVLTVRVAQLAFRLIMRPKLDVGNRLYLSGGHSFEPPWLNGAAGVSGTLVAFIPGQNSEPAAVVELDSPIAVGASAGAFLVLELRFVGASWENSETVHLELCRSMPEAKAWQYRTRGEWVESHATYRKLQS